MNNERRQPRKTALLLGALAAGMFGFGFALVPLYNVFCELTGINGRASTVAETAAPSRIENRQVRVEFVTYVNRGTPSEFHPVVPKVEVRPGEFTTVHFTVRNRGSRPLTVQAIPSISPGVASLHLHKTECFCFAHQNLAAGEEVEMPVRFFIDPELPGEVKTVSLAYTLYAVDAPRKTTMESS